MEQAFWKAVIFAYVGLVGIRDTGLWLFETITGWFLGGHIDMKQAATIAAGIALFKALEGLGNWPYVFFPKFSPVKLTGYTVEACGNVFDATVQHFNEKADQQLEVLQCIVEELRDINSNRSN